MKKCWWGQIHVHLSSVELSNYTGRISNTYFLCCLYNDICENNILQNAWIWKVLWKILSFSFFVIFFFYHCCTLVRFLEQCDHKVLFLIITVWLECSIALLLVAASGTALYLLTNCIGFHSAVFSSVFI